MKKHERLKFMRTLRDLDISELSELSGINEETIKDIESCGHANIHVMKTLARTLQCDLRWLISEDDETDNTLEEGQVQKKSQQTCHVEKLTDLTKFINAKITETTELSELHGYFEEKAYSKSYDS